MPRPRKTIDAGGTVARLDGLRAAVRREADPFDDAMVAAVAGVAEALEAEADALAGFEARFGKVARRVKCRAY